MSQRACNFRQKKNENHTNSNPTGRKNLRKNIFSLIFLLTHFAMSFRPFQLTKEIKTANEMIFDQRQSVRRRRKVVRFIFKRIIFYGKKQYEPRELNVARAKRTRTANFAVFPFIKGDKTAPT